MVYVLPNQTLLIVRLLTQTIQKIALYATLDISSTIKSNASKSRYCFVGKLIKMTLKNVGSVLRATESVKANALNLHKDVLAQTMMRKRKITNAQNVRLDLS